MSLVVVDYGRGNLYSLTMALTALGYAHELTSAPDRVASAERIILPGVGAFGDCIAGLKERGLVAPIVDSVRGRGVPFLGICVGMQIMAEAGEEFGHHDGLGLLPGVVRRLPEPAEPSGMLRVPNVGWRVLQPRASDPLLGDLTPGTMAYFVHSFAFEAAETSDVAATFDFNGKCATAVVHRDNMVGFQFHPEKSGPEGLAILRRVIDWMPVGA